MKNILLLFLLFTVTLTVLAMRKPKEFQIEDYASIPDPVEYQQLQALYPDETLTKFTPTYISNAPEEENLEDIQCPIPRSDRVPNGTGIQCVWSSIEMIGRWAEEPKLMNPPLTSRKECKSYSGPSLAKEVLDRLGVKFEQTYRDKAKGIAMIKKAMEEGRGCVFDVPGHAMVLVHYDEEKNVVKWVDNSDSRLAVQTMTIDRFMSRWGTWVLVVYADKDIVGSKLGRLLARKIPIFDNDKPQEVPKDYIPIPNKNGLIEVPFFKTNWLSGKEN